MHFLLIQLFFIIFSQKVFAAIYNSKCTTKCNSSGMICVKGQCKCDSKNRLFWTGARCLSCPNNWAMSETECIGFFGTKMSWMKAAAACQNVKADLISLRNNSILPLVYQITGDNKLRKKRYIIDKTIVWTSAQAIELINLGLYQWSDKTLKKFDSTNPWWCRMNIAHLGYYHAYNEPTRQIRNNDAEKCVLFRRGKSSIQMVCLDDVLCGEEYPFICEKSESTAQKYSGNNGNEDSNEHRLGMLTKSHAKKIKSIIIIAVMAVLLIAAIIIGLFFLIKHRNAIATQFNIGGNGIGAKQTSSNKRASEISGTNASDISDADESSSSHHVDIGGHNRAGPEKIDVNMDSVKPQKTKRGGYSKQKFDEFE